MSRRAVVERTKRLIANVIVPSTAMMNWVPYHDSPETGQHLTVSDKAVSGVHQYLLGMMVLVRPAALSQTRHAEDREQKVH